MDTNIKCKICRRAGAKLMLKGTRCYGQKCAMVRRPTAPGKRGKRRARSVSEFGRELREKQRMKAWYNLREQQFKNYVRAILAKKGSTEDLPLALMSVLENRLDNIVFRLGFAPSRINARQLVSHKSFLVNGKPCEPSFVPGIERGCHYGGAAQDQKDLFHAVTAGFENIQNTVMARA